MSVSSSSEWSEDSAVNVLDLFMTKATSSRFDVPLDHTPAPCSTQGCLDRDASVWRLSKLEEAINARLGGGYGAFSKSVASLVERICVSRSDRLDRARGILNLCEMPVVQEEMRLRPISPAAFINMTELTFISKQRWYRDHTDLVARQRELGSDITVTNQYECPSCGRNKCAIVVRPSADKIKWGGDSDGHTVVRCEACHYTFNVN